MKRLSLLLAVAVLLAADAFILVTSRQNRSGEPEARLELTERELPLPSRDRENTALALRLNWWSPREDGHAWLGTFDKLRELGFDPEGPQAESHAVYAVLEMVSDDSVNYARNSRLIAVDAGTSLDALRRRYPDRARYAVVRAVVRKFEATGKRTGRVNAHLEIVPSEVWVPPEYMHVFNNLEARWDWDRPSRYTVTVCYGDLALPWICGARRTNP